MSAEESLPPLPNDMPVYRVVKSSSWFDKDTGELLPEAFKLKPHEDGVSVCYNCSILEAHTSMNISYGVAQLEVGTIRNIDNRLDVIPDTPSHAEIKGLPRPEDDDDLASTLADLIARTAQVVLREKYVAPKK